MHLTRLDEFALLTLDRPEALNALSFATAARSWRRARRGRRRAMPARCSSPAPATARFAPAPTSSELMGRSLQAARDGAAFGQAISGKARYAADPVDRAAQRLCLWRRPRTGARLHLPLSLAGRQARPARDQARPDPRLWRNPAPAAADRRSARARHDPDRARRRRRRGTGDRPRQPHRRRRSGRSRQELRRAR